MWGDGGVVVTNNKAVADKLLLIRNHGLKDRDTCEEFSYNSRLDTIQAVVAQHLIDNHITTITNQRIEHAQYLDRGLTNIKGVTLPRRSQEKKHVYHLYMGLFDRRDELKLFLQNNGIDAKIHYPVPMHLQPAAKQWGHRKGDFPEAEKIADNCLSLPVHEFITLTDLDYMIETIKAFYDE